MARNKYPERTVEKILDVSEQLFMEKGYADTAMQDILDALKEDMTKGAVYHHFKSKVDIYSRIVNNKFEGVASIFREVADRTDLSGAEKITVANSLGLTSPYQETLINFMAHVQKKSEQLDPTISAFVIRITEEKFIPLYKKCADEGVQDGSISFGDGEAIAEALVYVLFVWLTCRLTVLKPEDYLARMSMAERMFDTFGIKLVTDEARAQYREMLMEQYGE